MRLWPVKEEVRNRLALAIELGANACVVRVEARGIERRIIRANEAEELFELRLVERIVDLRNPLDVGPEFTASADVDRYVQPEPCAIRHRIDVAPERRLAGR